jgi:hypothetical protein
MPIEFIPNSPIPPSGMISTLFTLVSPAVSIDETSLDLLNLDDNFVRAPRAPPGESKKIDLILDKKIMIG